MTNALAAVEAAAKALGTAAALEDDPPMLDREGIAWLVEGRTTTDLPALRLEQWSLYEGRIDRVVDYAAAVTRHLPVIRSTTVSTAASAW